ncbi:hypothetical protein JIR001_09130 [Polycladomyces abyssicola]|uniref:Uncharacterized protein n=1 Tax=Polycladomyces abyssicola TaxID=1125966 RepID=A0A8D5UFN8_9BACL|nr:hypothetical protein JIR001_09130 [Polycladomyces abyssicola]
MFSQASEDLIPSERKRRNEIEGMPASYAPGLKWPYLLPCRAQVERAGKAIGQYSPDYH